MNKLGRGLGALIQETPESIDGTTGITTVDIAFIHPNRYQPRKVFDQEKLQELSNSIKENGMIQPIIVTKQNNTDYELIAGERRLEAAKLANMKKVPVIIRSVSDKEQLQFAIIENIQRENLNCMEEAKAFQQLADEFSMTHAQIAEVMGKSRTAVSNLLRLLQLPDVVQTYLMEEKLTAGHARAILSIPENMHREFANKIIKENLSVRQAESEAKSFFHDTKSKIASVSKTNFKPLEKELKSKFNLKVKISDQDNKGKITIYYNSKEERTSFIDYLKQ